MTNNKHKNPDLRLQGIDHLHLYVTSKKAALEWYQKHLGFSLVEEFESWNTKNGPMTLSDTSGKIHLAFFERQDYAPISSFAFATSGEQFLAWKTYFEKASISTRCSDHELSWSLYFSDPFGHNHEITTYEVDKVRLVLSEPN